MIRLGKKLESYTNKDGVEVQTHRLYIIKDNGWKIRVQPCFKGRDFYDLLEIAEDLDESAD